VHPASAVNAKDLYFAGFSFAGNYLQNSQLYPVAESLKDEPVRGG
jgi:hypothetical protein